MSFATFSNQKSLKQFAPAKVNLSLRIGKKIDGLHQVETVICFCDFGDMLSCEVSDKTYLSVNGLFAKTLKSKLSGEKNNNLVLRALSALSALSALPQKEKLPEKSGKNQHVRLVLEKHIPLEAGLGGGSSDGAACLRLLNQFWGLGLGDKRLAKLGAQLGADVPACLYGRPCFVQKAGQLILPLKIFPDFYILLVKPQEGFSTKYMFQALSEMRCLVSSTDLSPRASKNFPPQTKDKKIFCEWLALQGNDFTSIAIQHSPSIKILLDRFSNIESCLYSSLSGSGSACFGLFATQKDANKARFLFQESDLWVKSAKLFSSADNKEQAL